MASSPPPLPPSPSLDDLIVPPISPTVPFIPIVDVPKCEGFFPDDASLDIFPPIDPTPVPYMPPTPIRVRSSKPPIVFESPYTRGRSCSRSRSPSPSPSPIPIVLPCPPSRNRSPSPSLYSPIYPSDGPTPIHVAPPSLYYIPSPSRSSSPDSSRSPSLAPPPKCYSYLSRTPSPLRPSSYNYTPPQFGYPPPVPPIMTGPTMTPPPPVPLMWQPSTIGEPVDILTYHFNKNMAYAPAAKTYDEAIDNVLELWPDLHQFDRDSIHLLVGGADQLVRVPKMAWQLVMCDLPRYEIMHVQVDHLPPPPQYDGKGNWAGGDDKKEKKQTARSGGFFSSIKRIFGR